MIPHRTARSGMTELARLRPLWLGSATTHEGGNDDASAAGRSPRAVLAANPGRPGDRRDRLRPAPTRTRTPARNGVDSAGIEIVENHAPEWGDSAQWSVDPEPEFVIGGSNAIESPDDASRLIWRVRGLARLSDGNILVHSGGEEAVFLFKPSGELVTRIGRKGRGPGEFVRPEHIQVLPGDTIVVWDYGFSRVNHFDSKGTFVGARQLDVATVFDRTRTATESPPESIMIPLPDGSFVVQRGMRDRPPPRPGEIQRRPVEYLRIDTAYALHSFGWWRWDEQIGIRSRLRTLWPPFARRSIVAAGGNPPSAYITDGDRFEIHRFAADGSLTRILRRDADPVPITSEEVAEWRARVAELNPGFVDWDAWERSLAAAPPREFHPPILLLNLDTEGYLWVRESDTEGHRVFDPEGRWLGNVNMPGAGPAALFASGVWIDEEMILLLRSDPDTDVQRIEGYRLRRDHPRALGAGASS